MDKKRTPDTRTMKTVRRTLQQEIENEVNREFDYSHSVMGRGYSQAYRKDVLAVIRRVFAKHRRAK